MMRSVVLILCFVAVAFSQKLTPPGDLPSGNSQLGFSKIVCDINGNNSDDIFTLWWVSTSSDPKCFVAMFDPLLGSYFKTVEIGPTTSSGYNDELSCGKLDASTNIILFNDYLISATPLVIGKKKIF
jgi:hypothetical protein